MRFVFGAKARELHANQICKRDQSNSVDLPIRSEFWCGLRVLTAHLLARENQMDCPSGGWPVGLYQHVHCCYAPVLESERRGSLRDFLEVFAPDGDIDIF